MENISVIHPFSNYGDSIKVESLYYQKFSRIAHVIRDYTIYEAAVFDALVKHYQGHAAFEYFTESRLTIREQMPDIYSYTITLTEGLMVACERFVVESCIADFKFKIYHNGNQALLDEFLGIIKPFRKTEGKYRLHMVVKNERGYRLKQISIRDMDVDICKHYNDDFQAVHVEVEKFIQNECSGLVILHGKQGTGKSSYIRHLINTTKKSVIYITSDMAQILAEPSFIPFIMGEKGSILVIEDCEELLAARSGLGRVNTGITNILNMSDGLLGDMLQLKFICTFNASLRDIDKALLRKGRLAARYEFKDLTPEKANALIAAQQLDIPLQTAPISLADLYHYEKPAFEQLKKTIGF